MSGRDPVEANAEDRDLYDVSTWEPRTALDRLATKVYRAVHVGMRVFVVLLALAILGVILVSSAAAATFTQDPRVIGLVVLSVVPALALAVYFYWADVTTSEPLGLLVVTFLLGVIFASFAYVLNSVFSLVTVVPVLGIVAFFYLVVGPVEESVKLLAIRLYAFRDDRFDAVVDGAVYGAVAGLGFATIENALYITRQLNVSGGPENAVAAALGGGALAFGLAQLVGDVVGAGAEITAFRALAGPGHVIYSAFAGYYLGLAKFNRENAGPIVVKGLLIASFIHATYNTLVGPVPGVAAAVTGSSQLLMFFAFVILYDGLFGYILYRKLKRYRKTYRDVGAGEERTEADITPERTEFERSGFD
jgi:RsiW-degrading membrane proteinase PrsW (M82 family)